MRDVPHSISRVLNGTDQTTPTTAFLVESLQIFCNNLGINQCMAPMHVSSDLIEVQRVDVVETLLVIFRKN